MKRHWPWLLLIIAVAILLRTPVFFADFINIDENEYAIAAQKILAGGFPYKDVLNYQPPIINYLYALGFWLSGGTNIWSAHIISILFVVGTIVALYFLAAGVSCSKKAGLAAALAYGIFSTTFFPQDMLAANCEILMMLPLTLSVLMLFYAGVAGTESGHHVFYLLAGIFAALGTLTKYQGGVVVAAEGFYILILSSIMTRSFSVKRNFLPAVLLTVGFFIPVVLTGLYLWHAGALNYGLEALRYIFLYAQGPVQNDLLYMSMKFVVRTFLFMIPGAIMWFGAFVVIVRCLKKPPRSWLNRRGLQTAAVRNCPDRGGFIYFAILWFFVSFIPVIVGGRIYFHYYFMTLPPAALLFGVWWHESGERMKRWLKTVFIVWLAINAVGWAALAMYIPHRKPGRKEQWIYVTEYLKNNTGPGETLFVWGCAPQIYIGSGLKAGTRFLTADYLNGRSPMTAGLEYDPATPNPPSSIRKLLNDFIDPEGVVIFNTTHNIFPRSWEYLKEDFDKGLPTYIVDTVPGNYRRYGRYPVSKFPYLDRIIKDNYRLVESIRGFDIYQIQNPKH